MIMLKWKWTVPRIGLKISLNNANTCADRLNLARKSNVNPERCCKRNTGNTMLQHVWPRNRKVGDGGLNP